MEQEKVAALVEENMKTIFTYALSRVGHKEDAEDLAADIITAILANAEKIRDDEAFYGYIWAVASNLYKKYLRQKYRRASDELDENVASDEDFAGDLAQNEQIGFLRRELALLSKEYRQCTVAYYFDKRSCSEIAAKYGYSLEMVKYYLFKTRKLLKEGIGMERVFGEKSYNPAPFEFSFFYNGKSNQEFLNLFDRKLPGNILLSAYYTPVTIRELSIELGVATAYLEDEIRVLENYGFLTALPGGKYQTKLVIFTEAYEEALHRQIGAICTDKMGEILSAVKAKLPELRKIGFMGADFDDNRLLWALIWLLMRDGNGEYMSSVPHKEPEELYDGATGVCYGRDYQSDDRYSSGSLAGNNWYSDHVDRWLSFFGDKLLPEKNRIDNHYSEATNRMESVLAGQAEATFPIFTEAQLEEVTNLLKPEIQQMGELYGTLAAAAVALMKEHSPASVADQVEFIIQQTLLSELSGSIAVGAVESGELTLPAEQEDYIAMLFGCYESTAQSLA